MPELPKALSALKSILPVYSLGARSSRPCKTCDPVKRCAQGSLRADTGCQDAVAADVRRRERGLFQKSAASRRRLLSSFEQLKLRALAHEPRGIVINQLIDRLRAVTAFAHFQCSARHRQRHAHSPIAGAIHPE